MLSKSAAYDEETALQTWPYEPDDEMTELRLVPENPAQLDAMFKALCECAAMNPDDDEDGEEDGMGEAGDFFYDEEVRLRELHDVMPHINRPISVYRSPRRALTLCPQLMSPSFPHGALSLCPQLCMGILPRRYTEIGLLPPYSYDIHHIFRPSLLSQVPPGDAASLIPVPGTLRAGGAERRGGGGARGDAGQV